ncbi:hypothetical protein OG874_25490 [Nocardia sp. NBC_00565]|uniref:hypothetical protein n=1 Tax=Nocardia sp. NBC_00565 TaxID=2975993 RepID=UPI002E81EBEA|nr:hypothetical protein [Nocardia sp. NBC_00565]WUC00251.1 hypothetical protein OG874_25490 [Nocardia sp. NBC_00565]
MGLSDEEGWDDEVTSQQIYYGQVAFARKYDNTVMLDKLLAGGPPPPNAADGVMRKILWHEHHAATVEELTVILEQMRQRGLVTDTGPRAYTGPISPANIPDLKAHMVDYSRRAMDAEQPAENRDSNR